MTQRDFTHLLESLPALSPEQMQALRHELDSQLAVSPPSAPSDEAVQRRLLAAGIISEIKPPVRVETGTERFPPVAIIGEPLSETVIRDRR